MGLVWLATAISAGLASADATTVTQQRNNNHHTTRPGNPLVGLSPQQLAGQRVICGYHGLEPPASLLEQIRTGQAAGVIFFGDNISSAPQIRSVIQRLDHAQQMSPVKTPLLMMVDQEGGQVRRLPGAPALSEKQIGHSPNPVEAATQAGTGAGQNLAGAGMNVNLAPVLDVYRRPGNFIDQWQRSYGTEPGTVASLGSAFIQAQRQTKVLATAKHFPGLGAATTDQNTDTAARPVTLNVPLGTLRGVDEQPYRAAIKAGVGLVMVSWATYPALDSKLPAGLSSAVTRGELRGRLGFSGVTLTDSLDAGAVNPFGPPARRAVMAAQAGADLELDPVHPVKDDRECQDVTDGLAAALQSGQLYRDSFDASVLRVRELRTRIAH